MTGEERAPQDDSTRAYAFESKHPLKFGLPFSSGPSGKFTSVPYVPPPVGYVPVGNTLSCVRPYWRIRRRMSPSRWPRLNVQNARSRNKRLTAASFVAGV